MQVTLGQIDPPMMAIYPFGEALLETEDLDPIYVMLHRASLPPVTLKRWCLAYWCFYHAGVASDIAESEDFYAAMRHADVDKWPRGTERRHFRGAASTNAIEWLSRSYPHPEDAVDAATASNFVQVSKRVQQWPQFGPWIAYKVADMLERVIGVNVDFGGCELAIYKEPAKAAAMLMPDKSLTYVVNHLIEYFAATYTAPPKHDRPVNVQEIETIMCKWKSHCNGHYPIGKDTEEIRHGLDGRGVLAKGLIQFLPQQVSV